MTKHNNFSIQIANYQDIDSIVELFQLTILTVNRGDYSQSEVENWASCGNDLSKWQYRIDNEYFIIAKNDIGAACGFASIRNNGYLNLMYVGKDYQKIGVGTELLNELEKYANQHSINEITSEVSITARQFFEHRGYVVKKEQKSKARNLYLTNYVMFKRLDLK